MRWLILLHRYLGIGIGWLVVVWCVSGIVMMYVPYPEVSFEEHIEALPTLELGGCCVLPAGAELAPDADIGRFAIETFLGEPVLTASGPFGGSWRLGLRSGKFIGPITADEAVAIADERTAHWPGRGAVRYTGETVADQWTVGYYRPDRIFHRLEIGDAAGSQWYIDASDGELVQATTRRERAWNWIGSVAHWLYPTALRRNGPLWADIVIWTAVAGLFLTAMGLYIGIARLGRRRGRLSPYRGVHLWHHYLGLAFGLFTLTWLLSGLLSMNPWGLLVGSGGRADIERLQDVEVTGEDLVALLARLDRLDLPEDVTYLRSAPFLGHMFLVAYDRKGFVGRYDADSMTTAPVTRASLDAAAARLLPGEPVRTSGLIDGPDAYYYGLRKEPAWPVFRIEFADAERTRYYIDPVTGSVLARLDGTARAYRWLFTALHSLDFAAILRQRPIWDVTMILLLGGVIAVSATGVYMGFRSLVRRA